MRLLTWILIMAGFVATAGEATAQNKLLASKAALSEESFSTEDSYLLIPDGREEGTVINKAKLEEAIAKHFEDIEEVSVVSLEDEMYFGDAMANVLTLGLITLLNVDHLTLVFIIKKTSDGLIADSNQPYIQCEVFVSGSDYFTLLSCQSETIQVVSSSNSKQPLMKVRISDISVSIEELSDGS